MRRSCLLVLPIALAVCAGPARAQVATEAQLLFERGAELYRERRFGEALEAMVESNRLVPNANVVFNVAQIYELLDRPTDAFNWYQRHLGFALDDAARARAEERIEKLRPRVAVLDVQTQPPGAEVYIDRVELGAMGKAPRAIAVVPGEHLVIAQLEGYVPAHAATRVAIGERTVVALELERLLGRLELSSEPEGALVLAEGQSAPLGRTPLELVLPAGAVHLRLRQAGHIDQLLEVHIDADQLARRYVVLARDPAYYASLNVVAEPAGALVRLDGRAAGRAPLTLEGLSPGVRALEVGSPEHRSWSTSLQLIAGSTTHVNAQLVARADEPWPYWSWIGYGAGAALFLAGATVGIAAYAENQSAGSPSTVENLNHVADGLMGAGVVAAGITLLLDLTSAPPPSSHGEVRSRP